MLWTFMIILSDHIIYYYYHNQYYYYTTKTYLQTLNRSQYESYTLIAVSKYLCTLFFFSFSFHCIGEGQLERVKGLKSALLSFQIKLYLENLLTRIWFFQKTVSRKLTLKLFFRTLLCFHILLCKIKYCTDF